MKNLLEIREEIRLICEEHPVMEDRLTALKQAGYENIEYRYMKGSKVVIPSHNSGLYKVAHLPRKNLYRIQIGFTELQKGYPAAYCVDVSSLDVEYEPVMPF